MSLLCSLGYLSLILCPMGLMGVEKFVIVIMLSMMECYLTDYLPSLAENAQLTPLLRLGAGACAGIIAMSATYPMDLVRGRLTVQVLCRSFGKIYIRKICHGV